MLDPFKATKIKNNKIQLWRAELGTFSYRVEHTPGVDNVVPDALSRPSGVTASLHSENSLETIHSVLGHPGVRRLNHLIREKNLPFTLEEIRRVCRECKVCAELKPRFFKPEQGTLIKATRPWERIAIDFKGPVKGRYSYLLVVIDEFSRFPFAFPCRDVTAKTVIDCLMRLFCLFGLPGYVHSDRGAAFMSSELREFLLSRNVATSRTTPYHPEGNSQCERLNSTLWKTVKLLLHTRGLQEEHWEQVLPDALHAIRSLFCTATNQTPHERFMSFERRSMLGKSLPSWLLTPGPVFLRRFIRNKSDPLVDEVELLSANHNFAFIRHNDGRESSVSTRDLAPCPERLLDREVGDHQGTNEPCNDAADAPINDVTVTAPGPAINESASDKPQEAPVLRRSARVPKPIRPWPENDWTT